MNLFHTRNNFFKSIEMYRIVKKKAKETNGSEVNKTSENIFVKKKKRRYLRTK